MSFRVKWQLPGAKPIELFESEDIRLATDQVRESRFHDRYFGGSDEMTWLEDEKSNVIPVTTDPEDDEPIPGGGY